MGFGVTEHNLSFIPINKIGEGCQEYGEWLVPPHALPRRGDGSGGVVVVEQVAEAVSTSPYN